MGLNIKEERLKTLENFSKTELESFVDEVTTVCQIPSPSYQEEERAKYLAKRFTDYGLEVEIDDVNNVIGFKKGNDPKKTSIMFAAHIDTVFPAGTDVSVRRKGDQLFAPGIRDNSAGVAAIILLAKALSQLDFDHGDIYLVGTACEEGLGDLRGMKAAFKKLKDKIDYVIAVDGNLGGITHGGIGSKRIEVKVTTEGGHSWGDFGAASAVHSLGKMISQISELKITNKPKTSYNVGVIQGGTSINTIASEASMLVDMRSEMKKPLDKIYKDIADIINSVASDDGVAADIKLVGDRPVGYLPREHILIQKTIKVLEHLKLSTDGSSSSTDANVPLSQGKPAICLGVTTGKYAHRKDEILDISPAQKGILLLLLLIETL